MASFFSAEVAEGRKTRKDIFKKISAIFSFSALSALKK